MKKFMSMLVVALVSTTMSYAQSTLVATLSHGENITMYYGAYALRDAHNAAVSGDVINLSGGSFQAINITKAISLRGTGIDDANPTYIVGNFDIDVPESDTNRLSMEGVRCTGDITFYHTLNNPYFLKSQFYGFSYNSDAKVKNATFADCKITNYYSLGGTSTVQFINSYVTYFLNNNSLSCSASFINCVIYQNTPSNIKSSQLINCIIFTTDNSNYNTLPATSSAQNCVAINYYNLYSNLAAKQNCKTSTFAKMFKDFTGTYSDAQTFELTDEAKTKFLGTDGTEVGMHGGILPYNSTPSYPQITKMNVAAKTTADGKLSVEIEVSAAE